MVQLASLIACQARSDYRVMFGAALTVGIAPVEAQEIVDQDVPYVGMGRGFDFLHAINRSSPSGKSNCRSKGNRRRPRRPGWRRAWPSRRRSSAPGSSSSCAPPRRRRAAVQRLLRQLLRQPLHPHRHRRSTRERSRSRCSSRSAAANPRQRATSPQTSTSATTAARCWASSRSCCRSSATPHPQRSPGDRRGHPGLRPPPKGRTMPARTWLITGVSNGFGP